jgi:hypothetical protein
MRRHSTIAVRVQPPEDLVDFACSDSFRDHFAAQGLTYYAGRSQPAYQERRSRRDSEAGERAALRAAREENEVLRRQVIKLEARLATLERRLQVSTHEQSVQPYRGVPLDAA